MTQPSQPADNQLPSPCVFKHPCSSCSNQWGYVDLDGDITCGMCGRLYDQRSTANDAIASARTRWPVGVSNGSHWRW